MMQRATLAHVGYIIPTVCGVPECTEAVVRPLTDLHSQDYPSGITRGYSAVLDTHQTKIAQGDIGDAASVLQGKR